MDVIHLPAGRATDRALRTLRRDLQDLDGPADPHAHRPSVVRRLLAHGASPGLLDALLPGWSRYRHDGEPVAAGAPASLSAEGPPT